ncbi:MAG: hypothetical protein HW414_1749, partial [Dehalococcoidia bacterium]|nr:hypothetical protein [Dehalococcoidia bacterium]
MTTNRKWRLLFLAVSLAATLLAFASPFITPAFAADEPTGYRNVLLSVYPEYDDPLGLRYPALLVMVEGEIQGTAPPTTVRFLVPEDARMYSAGSGPRDKYIGGPPDRRPSDIAGWDEISYQLKTNYFVVEYYLAIPTSPDKAITAEFIPLFPIDRLTAIVQQPRRATDFKAVAQTQPVSQRQSTDPEG